MLLTFTFYYNVNVRTIFWYFLIEKKSALSSQISFNMCYQHIFIYILPSVIPLQGNKYCDRNIFIFYLAVRFHFDSLNPQLTRLKFSLSSKHTDKLNLLAPLFVDTKLRKWKRLLGIREKKNWTVCCVSVVTAKTYYIINYILRIPFDHQAFEHKPNMRMLNSLLPKIYNLNISFHEKFL